MMILYYTNIVTIFFGVVAIIPNAILSCISSGVCSGNILPAPKCQPPIQCNTAFCQPGYSCGHYGCARNRARSALTRTDGIIVPVDEFVNASIELNSKRNIYGLEREQFALPIEEDNENKLDQHGGDHYESGHNKIDIITYGKLTNPNYLFRQCCEDRHLPDTCLPKCHFNSFTKQTLQDMYFKTDACPLEAAADLQYCAAQGHNHVECCRRNGVHLTLAGEKCLTFCDQRANHVTKLDYTFIPCYDRFENMKRCFYDESKQRMEEEFRSHLKKNDLFIF